MEQLWKQRIEAYYMELRKYLRYMLNDHLLFVLVFGLGAGLYYYSSWIKGLDHTFPAALLMAVLLGAAVSWSPVYTFLKQADTVFLLPLEKRMESFFSKAKTVSLLSQSYILIAFLALFMPMYAQVEGGSFRSFFLWLVVLLVQKRWNLAVRWHILKFQDRRNHSIDLAVRLLLNIFFLYFLFSGAMIWLTVATAGIMAVYFIYFKKAAEERPLKWETLVDLEEKRMARFYRFANLFTDVPHLEGVIKRRKWLDAVVKLVPYGQAHTYSYLLTRTFVRTNEYFGLYIRLTMIAGVILAFSNQRPLQLIVSLLFIYLTGFQLFPMISRHESKIWVSLYPVPPEKKRGALLKLLGQVLALQALFFSLIIMMSQSVMDGLLLLVIGLLFVLIFVKGYAPGRLKKMENR
ncbi:MAG TPA: ABC transporter permease [Chondromyces sp.]|nr:ABC transporter permease [Chondromyces sp.]